MTQNDHQTEGMTHYVGGETIFFYEVLYGQAARSSSNNIADAELLGRILKWQSL